MMPRSLLLLLSVYLLSALVAGQETTPDPEKECLPESCPGPDCAPVDDCQYWIDLHGEPYFIPHATNCSRFWLCEPSDHAGVNVCLFECAACATWPQVTPQCPSHALFFDFNINYPDGPVCNWPAVINCTNKACPLPCQLPDENGVCHPECCEDGDCRGDTPLCDQDSHTCVPGCRLDEECENWNGVCPSCQWCDKPNNADVGKCEPGCLTDDQCLDPTPICNTNTHNCEPIPCAYPCCNKDSDCQPGYDTVCEIPPWNTDPSCEYCSNSDNGQEEGTCTPGCIDSHDKCPADYMCDGNHQCQPDCVYPCCSKTTDCGDFDTICQVPALNPPDANTPSCEYCTADGGSQKGECTPGCLVVDNNDPCPEGFYCDDTHECVPDCVYPCCKKSSDCENYDSTCQLPALHPPDANSPSCEYCTALDDGTEKGSCTPGCIIEHNKCPESAPDCNGQHECVKEGELILKKIIVKTKTCQGCSTDPANEGGAQIQVIGSTQCQEKNPPCICDTNGLDHVGTRDYLVGNEASFESGVQEDLDLLGECYQTIMRTRKAKISWTGPNDSTWSPDVVTIEDNEGYKRQCIPPPGTALTNASPAVEVTCDETF